MAINGKPAAKLDVAALGPKGAFALGAEGEADFRDLFVREPAE